MKKRRVQVTEIVPAIKRQNMDIYEEIWKPSISLIEEANIGELFKDKNAGQDI